VSCQTGGVKSTSVGFFIPSPPGPPGRWQLYLWRDQGGLPNDACGLECAVAANPLTIPVGQVSVQTYDWVPQNCPCQTTIGERIHIGAVYVDVTPTPTDWYVTRDNTQPSVPGRNWINLSGNHGGWQDLHTLGGGPFAHPHAVQNVIGTDCPAGGNPCVYPPAGPDTFDSGATVVIDLPALGINDMNVVVTGPTTIMRGDPILGGDNRYRIDTEMVALELQGISCIGPLVVRESPSRPSLGVVQQTSPGVCYPADSFFDVFLEINVNGMTLHNEVPIRMEALGPNGINSLPPYDDEYQSPFEIELVDQNGNPTGRIIDVSHIPQPPRDCFFSHADLQTEFLGPLQVSGITDVLRDAPLWNGSAWETRTEILGMDLRGPSPQGQVRVRESPTLPSHGRILSPNFEPLPPMQSFFDVFVTVDFQGQSLCNQQPFQMSAPINALPPIGSPFQSQVPVMMLDCVTQQPRGRITTVVHVPDEPFDWTPPPPPGRDCFCSTATVVLRMPDNTQVTIDNLFGPSDIRRGPPVQLPDGRYFIDTEILALNLHSSNTPFGPIDIHTNPAMPSFGSMTQMQPGPLFPMQSFFDVFVVIETQPFGPLHNQQPLHMQADISSIPPDEPYQGFGQVQLFDQNGQPTGIFLLQEIHDPGDPFNWDPQQCPIQLVCTDPDVGGVEPVEAPQPIQAVRLYAGLPNPFSGETTIAFDLKTGGQTLLRVYDIAGRLVQTLVESELPAQTHQEVTWNGTDRNGRAVSAGIYFVRLEAEGMTLTRKAILLR
jgi:hypothetical protein